MCEICDGKTYEEILEHVDDEVGTFGFSTLTIEGGTNHPPWAYTIGLVEVFDHPEICVVGEPPATAQLVLDRAAFGVLDGGQLPPGKDAVVDETVFHIDAMPPAALAGEIFAGWHLYYSWSGVDPPPDLVALRLHRCRSQHTPRNRQERRAKARGRHLRALR